MTTSLLRERYPDLAEELRESGAPEAGGPVDWRDRLGLVEADETETAWAYAEVIRAGLEAAGIDLASPRAARLLDWAERQDQEEGR